MGGVPNPKTPIITLDPLKIFPCNQGTKIIGIPKVSRILPKKSSTNVCGVLWNCDSHSPNNLAIHLCKASERVGS